MSEDYWDDPTEESTGFLTFFEGTILDSFWSDLAAETQGKVNDDKTQLFWNVRVDDVHQDYKGTIPETLVVNFGIGAKWYTDPENENRVDHEDDHPDAERPIKFNNVSGYGRILSMVAGKGEDALKVGNGDFKVGDGGPEIEVDYKGVADYFRTNKFGDARDATIWQGLRFLFRGVAFQYKNDEKKLVFGNAKPLPVQFLGTEDAPKEASVGKVDEPTVSPWAAFTDDVTAAQLDKLAKSAKDHESFVKNASLLPAVKADEALQAAVNDPANYGN